MSLLPSKVNILGIEYTVKYFSKPSDVDVHGYESLWGQTDYWTRTIRIYNKNRPIEDVWQTLFHEIFHAVSQALHLPNWSNWQQGNNHDEIDLVALALIDILVRNGWLDIGRKDGT